MTKYQKDVKLLLKREKRIQTLQCLCLLRFGSWQENQLLRTPRKECSLVNTFRPQDYIELYSIYRNVNAQFLLFVPLMCGNLLMQ